VSIMKDDLLFRNESTYNNAVAQHYWLFFPKLLGVNSEQAGATYSQPAELTLMADDVGRPEVGCPIFAII